MSENLVRVYQNCIQRSLRNFSRKSLIWIFLQFRTLCEDVSAFRQKFGRVVKNAICVSRETLGELFLRKMFPHPFRTLSETISIFCQKVSREKFKSAIYVYTWSIWGKSLFLEKVRFLIFFWHCAKIFLVIWRNNFDAIMETAFYVSINIFDLDEFFVAIVEILSTCQKDSSG